MMSNMNSPLRRISSRLPGRVALTIAGVIALMTLPASVWADEAGQDIDARLEGYASSVRLPEAISPTLIWMLLAGLAILVVAVLFKNAKRSHLD